MEEQEISALLVICSPYSLEKSIGCLEIGKHDGGRVLS